MDSVKERREEKKKLKEFEKRTKRVKGVEERQRFGRAIVGERVSVASTRPLIHRLSCPALNWILIKTRTGHQGVAAPCWSGLQGRRLLLHNQSSRQRPAPDAGTRIPLRFVPALRQSR